jgi:uncharacterized protein (DUF1015 family)
MSKVIPFRALVPSAEAASQMISPPYDVVSSDEARALAAGKPASFLHISKAEIDLDPGIDEHAGEVYQKAAANLAHFKERGYLVENDPAYYVYRVDQGGHVQTGLVAGASVDEYENGLIKKHEKTREIKVEDRARYSIALHAHAEPVMLVHRASDPISHLINDTEARGDPLFDAVDHNGVRHQLWRARNMFALQKAFEGLDALYIADGHHRSESALRVRGQMAKDNPNHTGNEAYNYFPVVIFPDDEVRIFQYDWDGDPAARPLSKYTMADVMKLSDENGIMPPKSTWFAPKLGSGLYVYLF